MKRFFLVSVPHMRGGCSIFWNFVKDDIIEEMRTTKILGYEDLIINYLNKRMVGGGGYESDYMGIFILSI